MCVGIGRLNLDGLPWRVQQINVFCTLINPVAEGRFRAVTHLDVSEADIDEALGRIEEVVSQGVR